MRNATPQATKSDQTVMLNSWLQDGRRHTPTLPFLADRLKQHSPELLLDTGTGSGYLLIYLLERGYCPASLYGCDIEKDHVALAIRQTGLPNIVNAKFVDANPFPGVLFGIVTAINWLQSDWQRDYAHATPRETTANYHERVIAAAEDSLKSGGLFIWDWHAKVNEKTDERVSAPFRAMLADRHWIEKGRMDFPDDRQLFPGGENYSMYLYGKR